MDLKYTIFSHGTLFCNLTIVMITMDATDSCMEVYFAPYNHEYEFGLRFDEFDKEWKVFSKNTISLRSTYPMKEEERKVYESNINNHVKWLELAVLKYLEHNMKCNGYVSDDDVNQAFHQYFFKYIIPKTLPGM